MKLNNAKPLPEYLYSAHDWISAAGEWDEALVNQERYAREAALNHAQSRAEGELMITVQDLRDVIEYHRQYETQEGRGQP